MVKPKIAFVKYSPWRGVRSCLYLNIGEICGKIFYLHFWPGAGQITSSILREKLEEDFRNRVWGFSMQSHKVVYFFLLLLQHLWLLHQETLHNLSILRLSSKIILKCTLERKFSINSGQSMGFPLNRRNLIGG